MGFLDKVKNMFTEEVEENDTVKVEKIKSEVTHVPIESPVDNNDDIDENLVSKFNFVSEETKPIIFDEKDFSDLDLLEDKEEEPYHFESHKSLYMEEPKDNLYKGEYGKKEEEKEEKKIFKPTPIISPIYGILDKNYHKEDIVSRGEVRETKPIDPDEISVDSIRNKAYGTLEDELENTLFGSNSILFKKEEEEKTEEPEIKEIEEEKLDNLTEDISKELDELLNEKEQQIEENEEEKKDIEEDDLLNFIDSTLYKEGDEE